MSPLIRTARITALLYLSVAVTGLIGLLLVNPRLFVPGDPGATLANLVACGSLARIGIAVDLGLVITQGLAAMWFYRLFRSVDGFAAAGIAAFGMANALTILGSTAFLATALDVAGDPSLAPAGGQAASAQLMYTVSGNFWGVAAVFFGLWLIPMGRCVLRSGSMPRALGWTLIAGGAAYLLSAFVGYLVPDGRAVADMLAIPASIGEFWMIGYLLIWGLGRRTTDEPAPALTGQRH